MQGEIKFAILLLCKHREVKRENSEILVAFFQKKIILRKCKLFTQKNAQWQRKQKN